jgi:hypothetical protein
MCVIPVSHASRIIIKAEASVDYERQKESENKNKKTSYHFVEGKFFKGYTRDDFLTEVSFFDIAKNLSQHLARQNYYPTSIKEENEVMLLVNWGRTAVGNSSQELFGVRSAAWGAMKKRANSKMLGFWDTMHYGNLMPTDHYELQALLNEERYFIVVVAFDNKKYNTGEKEILWATRFSMRSIGSSFDQAYPELTAAASDYFGKHIQGLTRKRTIDSGVEIGDIEVLGIIEEKE